MPIRVGRQEKKSNHIQDMLEEGGKPSYAFKRFFCLNWVS